jgi:biotin carboxyl carrier protein
MKENTSEPQTKLIAFGNENAEYEFAVKNNYEYSYKKHKIKVEIIEEADGFTLISANGIRYPVEIVSRQQNAYEILLNGVSYSFTVETPFSLKRKKILSTLSPGNKIEKIKAPMPGKILDIMVEPGQVVNIGEALLVLEAMKMQNTLTSTLKGTISKILIIAGDNVGKDDLLVEIERG